MQLRQDRSIPTRRATSHLHQHRPLHLTSHGADAGEIRSGVRRETWTNGIAYDEARMRVMGDDG